jgi:tetratricopeptide (TPR) repeat protein
LTKIRSIVLALICTATLSGQPTKLEQAWKLAANGQRAEAIQLLQTLIGSEPRNTEARLLLGSLLMEAGEKSASIEQLKTAVQQRPRSVEAQNALGEAYYKFGEFAAAKSAFENALNVKPDYGIAQLNLGQVLLIQGELDGAARHLDRAIPLLKQTDDAANAYYLRAKINSARSQPSDAATLLEAAVRLRPDFAEAWSELGQARKQLLDDAGALTAFEHAVSANPSDAVARYRLGAEYLHQGKLQPAVDHLRQAYKLNSSDQSTLNALQMALRQNGDLTGADAIKQQLAELLRDRDRINQNKLVAVRINNDGAALEKSGDLRGALDKYRDAAKLDPSHVGIRTNYGVALLRVGKWAEGLNELHEALQMDPQNEQLRTTLKDALSQAPKAALPSWKDEVH